MLLILIIWIANYFNRIRGYLTKFYIENYFFLCTKKPTNLSAFLYSFERSIYMRSITSMPKISNPCFNVLEITWHNAKREFFTSSLMPSLRIGQAS